MLIKILSLIVNFNLIFQPLTFNLYLSSLLNSKVQAQGTSSDYPEFEVEIVPIATASSTDFIRYIGDTICNPYEGNAFVPSPYEFNASGTITSYGTFIDKVKDRISKEKGCESIWPQILFRFKAKNKDGSNFDKDKLNEFLINNLSSTTFEVKINLNFRKNNTPTYKDLNLKYYADYDDEGNLGYYNKIIDETGIERPVNNIYISSINGRFHVYFDSKKNTTSTTVEVLKDEPYFDLYLVLRSHYYFRDEPYLDPIIDYTNKNVTTTHPEFPKRFIIKSISFEVNGQNLIKNVKFFKDAKSYGDYLEGIENSVDIAVSTTTFEDIEFTTDKNDNLKGIVGFFPAFIESLPQSFPDTIFGDACRYYSEKENGPIILLPYQFAAIYSVSVSATGTCDQPPIYDNGISKNANNDAICLKYTNRLVPCTIYGSAVSSTSLCMTGFPLFNKFDNGYYYETKKEDGVGKVVKYPHWDPQDKKGARILRKINDRIDGFPSMYGFYQDLASSTSVNDVLRAKKKVENDDNFKNLFKKRRIFSYQQLSYAPSSNTTYPITSLDQLLGEHGEEIVRGLVLLDGNYSTTNSGFECKSYTKYGQQRAETQNNISDVKAFRIYKCSSTIGDILVGILPYPLKDYTKDFYKNIDTYPSYYPSYYPYGNPSLCNNDVNPEEGCIAGGELLQLGKDYFLLGKDLDIFVRPPSNIQFSAPTSTPVSGAVFILNQPSTKYELSLLNYLPRIYRDNPVSYQFKAVSPFSIKNGTLATTLNDYFQYNEFFPITPIAPNSFSTFYNLSSVCTLPQEGFSDISLKINLPTFEEYEIYDECDWYYRPSTYAPEYCGKIKVPVIKENQCLTDVATGTLQVAHNIKVFTKEGGTPEERASSFLENYITLKEYREKGRNISKIKFEIFEKSTSSRRVAELEYERKYVPPPYLSQYIENIAKSIWGNNYPSEINTLADIPKHFLVQEVFSYLPVFLSLKKAVISPDSDISFENPPSEINLKTFLANIDWANYSEPLPWLYVLLREFSFAFQTGSTVFAIFSIILHIIGAITGLEFLVILAESFATVSEIYMLAAIIVDTVNFSIYSKYGYVGIEEWFMLGLRVYVFLAFTNLGHWVVKQVQKGINWIGSLVEGTPEPPPVAWMRRELGESGLENFKFRIVDERGARFIFSDGSFFPEGYTPGVAEIKGLIRYYPPEFIIKPVPLLEPYPYVVFYIPTELPAQTLPLITYLAVNISKVTIPILGGYTGSGLMILSNMAGLYGWAAKLQKQEETAIATYVLKSLSLNYGYEVSGLKIQPQAGSNKKYFPAFAIIGRPVFDPDYPEYGYYAPVRRFIGNDVVTAPSCKTLNCYFSTTTGEIEYKTGIQGEITSAHDIQLSEFNITSIINESPGPQCRPKFKYTKTPTTTVEQIPNPPFTIATFTQDYIGGSVTLKSYRAKLKDIYSESNKEFFGSTTIPEEFQGKLETTTHAFIKKNETSTLIIKADKWEVATSTSGNNEFECYNGWRPSSAPYNLVNIERIINYKINCSPGTKLKWKGMDVANTCLGWVCEYEPQWQPSLQEVTTTNQSP